MLDLLLQFAKTEAECKTRSFLGFPRWYQHLSVDTECAPVINQFNDIWGIAAAVLEILLRLGAFVAAGFIIFGGIKLAMSQGEPERIKQGKDTIINAVVGLVIAIFASYIVSIIARSLIK